MGNVVAYGYNRRNLHIYIHRITVNKNNCSLQSGLNVCCILSNSYGGLANHHHEYNKLRHYAKLNGPDRCVCVRKGGR